MSSITIPERGFDIEVYCQECGEKLTAQTGSRTNKGQFEQWIDAKPCSGCIAAAYKEGKDFDQL